MRSAARAVLLLLALLAPIAPIAPARAASAEVEEPPPVPRRAIAVGVTGLGATVGGLSLGGGGPTFEIALGAGRWQYFGEAALMWVAVGPGPDRLGGVLGRAGVGVRWLARSLAIDASGGIEMNLEASSGLQHYQWVQGGRLTRPDLGAGVSWQVRMYRRPGLTIRFSLRALFTPTDDGAAIAAACRGTCAKASSPARTPGFMGGLGVAW